MIDRLPAHPSAIAQVFQDVPPGWTYNPASWRERLPIIGVALLGFGIASYHVGSTHQCATRHLADGSSGRLGLRRSGADARSYCRPYDPYRRHDCHLRGDSACAMWINVPFGVWLIIAPWIVGYESVAGWNSVIIGLLIMVCSWCVR